MAKKKKEEIVLPDTDRIFKCAVCEDIHEREYSNKPNCTKCDKFRK